MSNYIRLWLKDHKINTNNRKIHTRKPLTKTPKNKQNKKKVPPQNAKNKQNQKNQNTKNNHQTCSQSQVQSALLNATGWSFDVNHTCNSQG